MLKISFLVHYTLIYKLKMHISLFFDKLLVFNF